METCKLCKAVIRARGGRSAWKELVEHYKTAHPEFRAGAVWAR